MISLKFVTLGVDGKLRTGMVLQDKIIELEEAIHIFLNAGGGAVPSGLVSSGGLVKLLERWEENLDYIQKMAEFISRPEVLSQARGLELTSSAIKAPLLYPPRIFCAAANYLDHMKEMGAGTIDKSQSAPFVFLKAPQGCIIGPGDPILLPSASHQVDWEVELAVIIGKSGRRIPAVKAREYVAGYSVIDDISARDLTKRNDFAFGPDWFATKSIDTFAPLGPFLVPRELVADPLNLGIRLSVNGQRMQDSNTGQMIFDDRELIEYISRSLTLLPGDIIATGTPAGVGNPRGIFLKPGDMVEAEIDGIGTLRNPVERVEV